ncbi:MAG: putative DNA binding domain-containing protein [Oligoflexia bacterium]|nr:putative DNA binding domain-containing protein [Oligoflexia bacterium]
MTDKQIKNLILTGEGYHIEFKQALDKSLIDEVCAFANSSGGTILMGVVCQPPKYGQN